MRTGLVALAVLLCGAAAFVGLPYLLGRSQPFDEFDAFIVVYVLSFVLLVSLSLKAISYLSLSTHDKIYVAVVVCALEFLTWDGMKQVVGLPELSLNFETETIKLDVVTSDANFNAAPIWICLIAFAALGSVVHSLGRKLIDARGGDR